jgi:apolipoprotein D and lipocalin family protein
VDQYTGLWHELYRIPNSFQDNHSESKSICFNTTAEYAVVKEGELSVTNTCTREESGKALSEVARAVATVVDKNTNAKLLVNFTGLAVLRWVGIGDGDYWILGLGPVNKKNQYAWAVVGSPSRKYGWILARDRKLPDSELSSAFSVVEAQGYLRSQFVSAQR